MNAVNILWTRSGHKNRTAGELFRGANRGFLNDGGNPDPVCRDFGGVASRSGPDFFYCKPCHNTDCDRDTSTKDEHSTVNTRDDGHTSDLFSFSPGPSDDPDETVLPFFCNRP